MDKFIVVGKTLSEIEEFMVANEQSKFRAKQLFNWVYLKNANFAKLET